MKNQKHHGQNTGADYSDRPKDMTLSRRIATYLSKFNWYHPKKSNGTEILASTLESAWEYFEHFTLPRYLHLPPTKEKRTKCCKMSSNATESLHKSEQGEILKPTRLYSFWKTSDDDLAAFGIGVAMYFHTLKVLIVICIFAGLLNVPTIQYFSSYAYSFGQVDAYTLIQGSAVCTNQIWEPCPNCTQSQWEYSPTAYDRYATTASGLTFIKVNHCKIGMRQGIVNYTSILFVICSFVIMGWFHSLREIEFDESNQTTSDYSLEVENPPKDCYDPKKYKEFFSQFGHVTCCTISLNNEVLVNALMKKRKLLFDLELQSGIDIVDVHTKLDSIVNNIPKPSIFHRMCFWRSTAHSIHANIQALDEKISLLVQDNYECSNVFITFETQSAQREALLSLNVRKMAVWRNNIHSLAIRFRFRGTYVLDVRRPTEPRCVRWQDLDYSIVKKILQKICTFFLALLFTGIFAFVITLCRRKGGPYYGAISVTILNTIAPSLVKILTNFESHSTEGNRQASTFIKTCLFRWTNTAIVVLITTPFTSTLSLPSRANFSFLLTEGNTIRSIFVQNVKAYLANTNNTSSLLSSIYPIFIVEMIQLPLLSVTDLIGHWKRHVLGPRATNRKRLFTYFQGESYDIGERYTHMTKVLFLTFFYAAIFPGGFFLAAITLMIYYWTDKFCLLKNWSPAPPVGTQTSSFIRHYSFTLLVLTLAIMSSYFWASFPFDNACVQDSFVSSAYEGGHLAHDLGGNPIHINIAQSQQTNYQFCNQNLFRYSPSAFPAIPVFQSRSGGGKWMNASQERLTSIQGWTSAVILALATLLVLYRTIATFIFPIFTTVHKRFGKIVDIDFSDLDTANAYIPQIQCKLFPYPKLACDISQLPIHLIGWSDPTEVCHKSHNLMNDVSSMDVEGTHLFGVVRHWPSPRMVEI